MVQNKKSPPKKSSSIAGSFLDLVAWGVREAALPIPDMLSGKKRDPKKKK